MLKICERYANDHDVIFNATKPLRHPSERQ